MSSVPQNSAESSLSQVLTDLRATAAEFRRARLSGADTSTIRERLALHALAIDACLGIAEESDAIDAAVSSIHEAIRAEGE